MSDVTLTSPREGDPSRLSEAVVERPEPTLVAAPGVRQPRGRLGEELVALVCLGLALGADLALIRVGLDAEDEGYFLEQATRVLRGQLPYRDFDSLYTPALLYVHAALLSLFSSSPIVDVRVVGLVSRLVLAAGLYLVCRPMVRPAIAVLPALYVLVALDRLPTTWEPHPGWPSAALTIVTVWAFTRLPSARGVRRNMLLVAIGALAALVFAFKQNAGVLVGLAIVVGCAWHGIDTVSTAVTRPLRVVQIVLLGVVVATILWLVHPHASASLLIYFMVPVLAAGFAALWPVRVSATGRGVRAWCGWLAWLGLGWSVVSAPWLIALLVALNGNVGLLKGFIGAVNQDVLWFPFEGPSGGAWAGVLGIAVGLLIAVRSKRRPLACVAALVMVLAFGVSLVVLTAQSGESILVSAALSPVRATDGVDLLLPAIAIVAGTLLAFRPMPARTAWWLRWMTVASALTFLTEYPRVDDSHLTWSAGLPLAIGAVVLARLYTDFTHRWSATGASRLVVAAALVIVPLTTLQRNLSVRSDGYFDIPDGRSLAVRAAPMVTLTGPPAVAGITVTTDQASTLVAAANFVAAGTQPDEAIFVYPTSPLLYVMANRPNPTRFAHLFPGAATPAELNAVIEALDQTPVELVVVNESDLDFWGPPGDNAPLENYLAAHYHQVTQFGDYTILRRT